MKKKKKAQRKSQQKSKKITQSTSFFLKEYYPASVSLVLLSFILYGASSSFDFVLDDKIVLSQNNFVQQGLRGIPDIFGTESFTGFLGEQQNLVVGARYRPLSLAMFAVEYEVFGPTPAGYHWINVLMYACTALLLFYLLALFRPIKGAWYLSLPFVAAALYVLHPIHSEVVANIKGRDEIVAMFLSLATLIFSFHYVRSKKIKYLVLSGCSFLLGLLAKENTITFLAVIPLSIYFFSKARLKLIGHLILPLGLSLIVYLLIRVSVIGYLLDSGQEVTGIMNNPFYGLGANEKYGTIMYTLGQYLKLLLVPYPLTHDYYPYQVPIVTFSHWQVIVSLLLYLGMGLYVLQNYAKRSFIIWCICYFLITLSIVSNIVFPLGAPMNERFMYMPSLAFCVVLPYLLLEKLPLLKSPINWLMFGRGLLLLIMVVYAALTIRRVPAWKNELSLNRAAVEVSTNSARANSYMGYSLYRAGLAESDRNRRLALFTEAVPYVDKALKIYPAYTDALTAKGGLVTGLYQLNNDLDRVLDAFLEILSVRHVPFLDTYLEYLNGRADSDKLIAFYQEAGYHILGLDQKNYALAIKYLNYGLQLAPQNQALLEAKTKLEDLQHI